MNQYSSLLGECTFSASRSGGAGGQNVNKVNTKIELRFCINDSLLLSEEQKQLIIQQLSARVFDNATLIIVSQTERTQLQNKEICKQKFLYLIEKALTPQKERKATKPSFASKVRRRSDKQHNADKKQLRRKTDF